MESKNSSSSLKDDHSTTTASLQISSDSHQPFKRAGTIWTAIAHIITGVIGAGVLSLAWSTAQLGWIAGPLAIVLFALITQISILLVCDCYRTPDPLYGPTRNRSFIQAVGYFLGKKQQRICGIFVLESFYGCGIAYTIVTANSVKAILRSDCYHEEGQNSECHYGDNMFMVVFGLTQIIMSQIPDFHNMAWLSVVAAIMSFCYAFIGFGLGFATVIKNREVKGRIGGVAAHTGAQKIWLVLQALGDIAFSYPYTQIVLDIQDTLRSPPPENHTMKRATIVAMLITTFFYLCCGGFGYAAFGNQTPGNLLTGFGFYEPYWLVDFANACIILHLVGGYQIYSQPVFAFVEQWAAERFPNSEFVHKFYSFQLPVLPAFQLTMLRVCFRTAYVISTTGLAMIFPYFNQVLGVLGALNFWPIAVYFPVEMYFKQSKTKAWTRKWLILQAFTVFCFIISVLALIGSIEGLIRAKFK